ncbi:MAG: DUF1571 domain-containing protein [Candidatus Auribacterota bacterium]|jgi:hypothetical protein|nr:DUF1571 domain-containing protein [Candidatus Auribacterota bacterium]
MIYAKNGVSIFGGALRVFLLIQAVCVIGGFARQSDSPQQDLLWSMLTESKNYYDSISSYSCTVTHAGIIEGVAESDCPIQPFELIFLKPSRYHIQFTDTDGEQQEFIFIEGDTHRQFLYPKEYKISGNGSLLYNGYVLSIPLSSLNVFYEHIIPLTEQNKATVVWDRQFDNTVDDTQNVTFSVTYADSVNMEGIEVKRISFVLQRSNSVPVYISFYDSDDHLINSLSFENIKFDIGITDMYFEHRFITRRREEDMVVESVMVMDEKVLSDPQKLQSFVLNLSRIALEKYTTIHDYSARFTRRERVKGQMQKPEEFFIKFRKPFDLYMKWISGPNKGWELIYARGKYNNQVVVHVTGLANLFLPTLQLDPAGALAMMNNRHSILEFGLGHVIENYYRDVSTAINLGELDVEYLGEESVDGRPCWVIQTTLPPDSTEYYCYQAKLFFDQEYKIPTKMLFYEWNDERKRPELIEEYTYEDISFNNRFTDYDFDRYNKEYDF